MAGLLVEPELHARTERAEAPRDEREADGRAEAERQLEQDDRGDAPRGAPDEASPVTAGAVGFGMQQAQLAEALDPQYSGFAGGAMVAAALALVGACWATAEFAVGDYAEVARMIAENWMMVLGGVVGTVLLFGGIGFGIGKATA